jgi:hypothetical protein
MKMGTMRRALAVQAVRLTTCKRTHGTDEGKHQRQQESHKEIKKIGGKIIGEN